MELKDLFSLWDFNLAFSQLIPCTHNTGFGTAVYITLCLSLHCILEVCNFLFDYVQGFIHEFPLNLGEEFGIRLLSSV
jgi:hypothetical protein